MSCNKKQICNVCNAPFRMQRGCLLEKRCPACRFLKLQKNGTSGTKYDLILKNEDTPNLVNRMKEDEERRESSIESIEQWETSVSIQEALAIIKKQLNSTNLDLGLSLLLKEYEGYTVNELAKEQKTTRDSILHKLHTVQKMLRHPKVAKLLAEILDIPYKKYRYSG